MLIELIYAGFRCLLFLFFTFEFGQQLRNAFGEIDHVFDQFNWYLFPIEVKRILPTVILYVQQPVQLKFFGSYSCNREHSKRVSHTSKYKYDLFIIKQIDQVFDK